MTDFLTELREELLDGLERYDREPRWRAHHAPRVRARPRPAARRIVAVAVAAAVAVLVAVMVVDIPPELENGAAPAVSRLEGFHATAAVAADGSLWVTQNDIDRLLRLDLKTGKLSASIDVGGPPAAVIAATGAIWVHDWQQGRLVNVEPRTNQVVKTIPVGSASSDITFAAGAIWAIDARQGLLRIDPNTIEVTKRVALGGPAPLPTHPISGSTLTAAGDTLWVIAADGHITEIDAQSGRILGRARGPTLPVATTRRTAADDNGLWISSPYRRELVHIDARTRRVTRRPVRGDPGPLALVDGRIWVGTLHATGALTRVTVLEPDGRTIATIPVPNLANNIIPSPDGDAWVTFGENGTVSPAAVRLHAP
jgi:streptogramin lyase